MQGRVVWSVVVGAGLALMPVGCRAQETPGTTAPVAGDFKTADELLDALETADRGITSLVADVWFNRTFLLQGDRQLRLGKLWFVSEPAPADKPDALPSRKFAIHFKTVFIGSTKHDEDKTYVFDGQWLAEKDGEAKFCQRKQVVGPGEHFDPLKIGQGPFALPIGQRKADITKRFTVELLPAMAGLEPAADASEEEKATAAQVKGGAEGCWQLKLVPKPEFVDDNDFSEIRLWYRRGAGGELLPRMARTESGDGVSTVQLTNVEVQLKGKAVNKEAAVAPELLDTSPPPGWDSRSEGWRKPTGKEPPDAGDK